MAQKLDKNPKESSPLFPIDQKLKTATRQIYDIHEKKKVR